MIKFDFPLVGQVPSCAPPCGRP